VLFFLVASPEDPGRFVASQRLAQSGEHSLRVWPGEEPRPGARPALLRFPVAFADRERLYPAADRTSLGALCAMDEGGVYELDQLDELADAFATRRVARTHSERQELWDAPSLWVLLFGFLFVEWAMRKRWRMA